MPRLKSKHLCARCGADTRRAIMPVRSTIYQSFFCDLKCFEIFHKLKKEEKDNELPANT
jgi:hypothetical protein